MNGINWKRVALGTLTGGIVWFIVGTIRGITLAILGGGGGGPGFVNQPGSDYALLATLSCPAFACPWESRLPRQAAPP